MIPEKGKQGKGLTDKAYCSNLITNQRTKTMNKDSRYILKTAIFGVVALIILYLLQKNYLGLALVLSFLLFIFWLYKALAGYD
jgi:hypothetical protein